MNLKEEHDRVDWNSFVSKCTNDTFHHSWEWGVLYESLGKKIFRIGVYDNGLRVALALGILVTARRGNFILIPHGPIFSTTDAGIISQALKTITTYMVVKAREHHCSFVRVAPIIERTGSHKDIFKKLGYMDAPIFVQSELSLILDIAPQEEDILAQMRKTTRQILRKGDVFGLLYTKSDSQEDFEVFFDLYSKTVLGKGFVGHEREFIEKEFQTFKSSGSAQIYIAYKNASLHTPLAGALIITQNNTGYYHYGASVKTDDNIPAGQLLQWYIIRDLKRLGFTTYNFWGISPENKPSHPWRGLSLFKRGFGGQEKAYLQTQDYVISLAYWVNWVIETVRRIKRKY